MPSEGSSFAPPSISTRLPVIRRCMTSVRPPASASSRYLPRRPRPSIVASRTAASSSRGGVGRHQRASSTSSRSIRRPASSGSSWRQTVSTSGSSGIPPFYRTALEGSVGGGARVRLEVDVLEPLAREVRVHLRRRDVGVAEHLLHGTQVAAPRQQVGGEAVAQRVRAHAAGEAGRAGVALDDLVEALAAQRAAAEVDEELRLMTIADQLPATAAQVDADRRDRLAAERHDALLAALAAGSQEALVQIDVADLQADRLRSPQTAPVHRLEQGAVALDRGI